MFLCVCGACARLAPAGIAEALQGLQKAQQLRLGLAGQPAEGVPGRRRFAPMQHDRVRDAPSPSVVEKIEAQSPSPPSAPSSTPSASFPARMGRPVPGPSRAATGRNRGENACCARRPGRRRACRTRGRGRPRIPPSRRFAHPRRRRPARGVVREGAFGAAPGSGRSRPGVAVRTLPSRDRRQCRLRRAEAVRRAAPLGGGRASSAPSRLARLLPRIRAASRAGPCAQTGRSGRRRPSWAARKCRRRRRRRGPRRPAGRLRRSPRRGRGRRSPAPGFPTPRWRPRESSRVARPAAGRLA